MTQRLLAASAAAGLAAIVVFGCGPSGGEDAAPTRPAVALDEQEDAVCGMLVRDQSAPRGQVVHRDGSRFFFCSLGDLLVHLGAPSPHGSVETIFVEVMAVDEDPRQAHTGPHPWLRAEEASFVVGIDRPGVMGAPVLSYATRGEAERVAGSHEGAQVLDLDALRRWWEARGAER